MVRGLLLGADSVAAGQSEQVLEVVGRFKCADAREQGKGEHDRQEGEAPWRDGGEQCFDSPGYRSGSVRIRSACEDGAEHSLHGTGRLTARRGRQGGSADGMRDQSPVPDSLGGFLIGPPLDGVFDCPGRGPQQRVGRRCQARS